MKTNKNKLILKKADYDLLVKYILSRMTPLSSEHKTAEQLYLELQNAEVFEQQDELPADVIQSNSLIEVEEQSTKRQLKFRLVLPEQANLNKGRLSLFSPLGIALMGYRKGVKVSWEMPAGRKVFYIREVTNNTA